MWASKLVIEGISDLSSPRLKIALGGMKVSFNVVSHIDCVIAATAPPVPCPPTPQCSTSNPPMKLSG